MAKARSTVLWEIRRGGDDTDDEAPGFVERLTETGDGLVYERVAPEELQTTFPDLRPDPFPDLSTALDALPEVLDLGADDEVTICALPDDVIAQRLVVDWADTGDEFGVGDRWLVWRGFAMPAVLDPSASWSNGDDYDHPGGDRYVELYYLSGLAVSIDMDRGPEKLGRFDSLGDAIDAWVERCIPGGAETYYASFSDDEDDEEWDDEEG